MDAQTSDEAGVIPKCLFSPQIRLSGLIDDNKFIDFQSQLDNALKSEGQLAVELTTPGGDADLARRIGMDIQIASEHSGREILFIGKTIVYSAGVTIMASFPRKRRYLTRDCLLLIHERRMDQSLQLSGPLQVSLQRVKALEAQLKIGIEVERTGFAMLCEGTGVDCDECIERARTNWYLKSEEALSRRLILGVL
ncbi:peptidase S14 [Mesorhizobium sp. AaZ16]|uniref:peptidase S14 n=1 Tax=Mesorhizobium sp. AaZ16 TaxID=3402289 RepID=UPI00374E2AD7